MNGGNLYREVHHPGKVSLCPDTALTTSPRGLLVGQDLLYPLTLPPLARPVITVAVKTWLSGRLDLSLNLTAFGASSHNCCC